MPHLPHQFTRGRGLRMHELNLFWRYLNEMCFTCWWRWFSPKAHSSGSPKYTSPERAGSSAPTALLYKQIYSHDTLLHASMDTVGQSYLCFLAWKSFSFQNLATFKRKGATQMLPSFPWFVLTERGEILSTPQYQITGYEILAFITFLTRKRLLQSV